MIVRTQLKLFKLHGTIEKDVADGGPSRLIITESDQDQTSNYRDSLYDRLKGDMVGGHLVIIGHSLEDRDIKDVVNRAAELGSKAPGAWRISLFLYTQDENRAQLFERRGFSVCFGGIDDFFAELARKLPKSLPTKDSDDPKHLVPALRPMTIDVTHASDITPNFSAMFNGWPASHADILAGSTFERVRNRSRSITNFVLPICYARSYSALVELGRLQQPVRHFSVCGTMVSYAGSIKPNLVSTSRVG